MTTTTTHAFQAEVKQLLKLMIHSLYSNKEIFLRELVSNASDACDKLRFEGIQNPELLSEGSDFSIALDVDKEAGTVTITDNGIGMSKDEIVQFLGTVASSGTREYLNELTGDQKKDAQLIGQFGVGFYSAFVVAERVVVDSRRAGSTEAVRWRSEGTGEYTLEDSDFDQRGTRITLHLREDDKEFADQMRLKFIVKRYSDHIAVPITLTGEDGEVETINDTTALWQRPKNEIEEQQYKDLYQSMAHAMDEPLAWSHNRVEGKYEYTSLFFIPGSRPFDLYEREQQNGIKLFIQRVFVLEDKEQLLPRYLRFVRGLVDSNDLPLNVSREILQSNRVVDAIRSGSVKKIIGVLESMSKNDADKYTEFWNLFGAVLKEGIVEDTGNKDRIAPLLRFASTHNDNLDETVTLDDYIGRMKSTQEPIYYMVGETKEGAASSPHIEGLRAKGIEVLILGDRIDEWLVSHLHEYEGKTLRSAAQGDIDLGEDDAEDESSKQLDEEYKELVARVQTLLSDKVEDVRLSKRLVESPSCVVAQEGAPSGFLQRMLEEAGQAMPSAKPVLELNPTHPLIVRMGEVTDDELFKQYSSLVYEQAILAEGGQLSDPAAFVKRVNQVILSVSD
ncbi:MAG: molecular chaperone HtpG [Gammaproteobacteria bacterium]